ncbi:hypothetical protein [Candidatus Uabimicrobium sp. HlEnr_7]|uniref:hypothetical protein n=1 Tax=Candidatus Uabimicrobium helgolandensis TaxID=3095367 RepID=UPI003557481C
MKKLAILLVAFAVNFVFAEDIDKKLAEQVKNEAVKMKDELDKKNYKYIGEVTHPKIIKVIGGVENVITMTKQAMEQQAASGFSLAYVFHEPTSIYTHMSKETVDKVEKEVVEYIVFIPTHMTTENADMKISVEGYMIATSKNKNKWYLCNGGSNKAQAQQLLDFLFPGFVKVVDGKSSIELPKIDQKTEFKNAEKK